MKSISFKACRAVLAAALALSFASAFPAHAETLGDVLREHGWEGIIGTWIDEDTRGTAVKTTYTWKFKDRVIEVTTRTEDQRSVALMGLNGKTGEVYLMSADNQGGGALGRWDIDEVNGDAILEAGFVSAEGDEGGLTIRHHLEDDDTMTVTIEGLGGTITLTLIREKK